MSSFKTIVFLPVKITAHKKITCEMKPEVFISHVTL